MLKGECWRIDVDEQGDERKACVSVCGMVEWDDS